MDSLVHSVPDRGRRLLPSLIDEISQNNPNRVLYRVPQSFDLKDGVFDVTFADFARAIDRAAEWIEERFGKSESFETLAYIAANDFRYCVMIMAACKVGFKMLFVSPRNSTEGQLSLFSKTDCKALITSDGYPISRDLLEATGFKPALVPSIADLLRQGPVKHYSYTKSFEEGITDPLLVLHTSGSTGLPKPIICRQGWACCVDRQAIMPDFDGQKSAFQHFTNKTIFTAMPAFHAAGVLISICTSIFHNAILYWPPSNKPVSAIVCEASIDAYKPECAFLPPSVIEEMHQSAEGRKRIVSLGCLAWGGGPISKAVGDALCEQVVLGNLLGTTEGATAPQYALKDRTDWDYFSYSPELKGLQFRPYGDGTFELVITRDKTSDLFHAYWVTFPESQEYNMNDLYIPHPTRAALWKYVGRSDDVIVFSNGEKLNPTAMEDTLRQHHYVKIALVVGQAHFSPGAIIELKDDAVAELKTAQQKAAFIEEHIWPLAKQANEVAPAHGHLALDKIVLANPEKPFLRAGKGTVQRVATVKLYKDEIEQLYSQENDDETLEDVKNIDISLDSDSIGKELKPLVEGVMNIQGLEREDDFFIKGMDSLMVMRTVRLLRLGMPSLQNQEGISTRLVYANPTLALLATAIKSLSSTSADATTATKSREQSILSALDAFAAKLPTTAQLQPSKGKTILLTGSTGSLGSYLLSTLLSNPRITKIYCLNRRVDAASAQYASHLSKGLPASFPPPRVSFMHADLSKPLLGLKESEYETLKSEVNTVIHTQWQVDFNLAQASFNPHIQGVVNLITLSTESKLRPEVHFTSSIGTLGAWGAYHGSDLVPEMPLTDPNVTLPQGYGESKWISERLLQIASEKLGVKGSVMRVGQVAGPVEVGVKGSWNRQEWLPSIIASSKYLGVVPEGLGGMGSVPWVPVDILAGVITELVTKDGGGEDEGEGMKYHHLVNPTHGSWSELVPVIQAHFASDSKEPKVIKAVPFTEWVEALQKSSLDRENDIEKNPGVKLLDFYESMAAGGGEGEVVLDTVKTRARSEVLRALKGVSGEWMGIWLGQWAF